MKEKLIIIGLIVALGLGLIGSFKLVKTVVEQTVGAVATSDVSTLFFARRGIVIGSPVVATSTSGTTIPLLASNFDDESVIDVTLNVQDATLSFPASTTIRNLRSAGDTKTILIRNATTTASMDLTISGGTGVLLKKATTTAVIYGDSDGANYGLITLTRKSNTDFEALLRIFGD